MIKQLAPFRIEVVDKLDELKVRSYLKVGRTQVVIPQLTI